MGSDHPACLALLAQVQLALARRGGKQRERWEKAAARSLARASRAARDPRRAEGRAYTRGLRAELLARSQTGRQRDRLLDRARVAYRRAVWLDPLHDQALTALAALALEQGTDSKGAGHLLERARAANPNSVRAAVLSASERISVIAIAVSKTELRRAHFVAREARAGRRATIGLFSRNRCRSSAISCAVA